MPWTMPHEAEQHERTWMAWPHTGATMGESAADADATRTSWAAVAHAVAQFEPVVMVVDPAAEATARRLLSADVDLLVTPLDDGWMRDIGPTFVTDGPDLAAVCWTFNGWGAQDWAEWGRDRRIGRAVAEAAGVPVIASGLVNEGGGIHVDGEGTVLATRTVQLDPHRNRGLTERDVESEFARTIGTTHTVWLPRGLTRDSERLGTRGHVDLVATFPRPGSLLVHRQEDSGHPDHAVTAEVRDVLAGASDARGRPLDLIDLPAPTTLRDAEGWVDWSYVNHYVVNDGVIACAFDDPGDDRAVEILRAAYPGRVVVGVDARTIFARGGGIHCITQQQPVAPAQP